MYAFIGWALLATAAAVPQGSKATRPVVAIDAGHGGDFVGAVGVCGLREKDLTLAVATRLKSILAKSGAAKPLLLRTGDSNPTLFQRAARANAAQAVLLVSIHANASPSPRPRGVETFFLSSHAADVRLARLAERENDGGTVEAAVDASDAALQKVLTGLTLDAAHAESQVLAMRIQDVLGNRTGSRARGVLQAPLHLLRAARMASVLVEVGFLTHPRECVRMQKNGYRQLLAEALANAIIGHLRDNPVNLQPQLLSSTARGATLTKAPDQDNDG